MSIRVVLADDHEMMRNELRLILRRAAHIKIVAEADGGASAVDLACRLTPDVVVMDIGMSDLNGVEATRLIKATRASIKVIGLSAHADRRYVLGMLGAGASGYLQKSAAGQELVQAIDTVAQGRKYLSSEIANSVLARLTDHIANLDSTGFPVLGMREKEVLRLLAEGKVVDQIAVTLHISPRTVGSHRRNILKKLKLHTAQELTNYALHLGLIDVNR